MDVVVAVIDDIFSDILDKKDVFVFVKFPVMIALVPT
jgi:hypothetical protein